MCVSKRIGKHVKLMYLQTLPTQIHPHIRHTLEKHTLLYVENKYL